MLRLRFVILPLFLAACAGGARPPGDGGSCFSPDGAEGDFAVSAGQPVVCRVEIPEDCTVFFGPTPVEAAIGDGEGTIEFLVPPNGPRQERHLVPVRGGRPGDPSQGVRGRPA